MGLERTSDNFDINAILSAVNGANGNARPQGSYTALLDDMDQQEAERLGLDNPAQLAIIRDISSMIEELQSNRSAGAGNELEGLITRIGGALPPGMSSAAANAIMIEVERRDRFGNGVSFNNEEWDRIKDEVKKEREAQARAADFADDATGPQLSTTPDRYGLSQQNYSDLNDELKTRDGQERFMSFLRMMNPGMSDEQIRRRFDDAQIVAAVRSGQATDAQRQAYNGMSDERRDDASTSLAQYQEMGGSRFTPTVENRADAQAISATANTAVAAVATDTQVDLLSGGNATGVSTSLVTGGSATTISRASVSAQVDGQAAISGAPSLRGQFGAALTATTPLDAPQLATATVAPAPVVPAANAGLDV